MKKFLSLVLAIILVLSIGTVGISAASNDKITISADVYHARKGDYAYFPVEYNCQKAYSEYAGNDDDSSTKIIIPLFYNDHLIEPIEATPSEWLYNLGGTAEIIKTDILPYEEIYYPYIYVEVNFDGCADIENGVFFNVKFKVVNDNFFDENGYLDMGGLFDNFYLIDSGDVAAFTYFDWRITKGDGSVKNISSYVRTNSASQFAYGTYEELLLKDYEPFIPPVEEEPLFNTGVPAKHVRKDDAVYYPIGFDAGPDVNYYQFRTSLIDEETVQGLCRTRAVMKFIYDVNTVEFIDVIPSFSLYLYSGEIKVLEHGSTGETGPDGQEYNYLVVELNIGEVNLSDHYSFFYLKFYVQEENFVTADGKVRTVVANADYEGTPDGKGCIWQFKDDNGILCDISNRVHLYDVNDYPESCTYNDLKIDELSALDIWEKGLSISATISKGHGRIDNYAYYPCELKLGKNYEDIVRNMTGFTDGSTQVKMKISYDSRTLDFVDALPSKELYDIGGTVTVIESGVMNDTQTYLEYVIVQLDFEGFEDIDFEYLYSLKFDVVKEDFVFDSGKPKSLVNTENFYINGMRSKCHWKVTGTNGRSYVLTEITEQKNNVSFDSATSYDALIIEGYEPFDPTLIEEKFEIIGGAMVKTQGGVSYITGLQPSLTKSKFQSTHIDSENVTIEISMTTARYMGTGSTVTVKSNDGEIIAEYVIVIYGDVDGTATINGRDATAVSNSVTGSADPLTGAAKLAANVEGTRTTINAKDASVIRSVAGGSMTIDQSTGKGVEA